MTLPDDVIVYPGHGAGSACGKNMSKETTDTLGHQKETNYALRADMTREEFIKEVTDGLAPPPVYFPENVLMNKMGYESGVVEAIAISRATVRNIKQNLFGAFVYNSVAIPVAAGLLFPFTGMLLNPAIAGAAMALSSVTVVSNANRLRWIRLY
jgi:hypothetical protein